MRKNSTRRALLHIFLGMTFLALQFPVARASNTLEDYEARRQALIESSLANVDRDAMIVQAYTGTPVDQNQLNIILAEIQNEQDPDFDIIKLVRILYLSDGEYDDQILPAVANIPLWFTNGEELRVYWSENHMSMYLGSAYLLDQKYGWDIHPTTAQMLRHWLQLKLDYGFYEFFSTTYLPFTFSALLNLADFAEDEDIKTMAEQVLNKLIDHLFQVTNDEGVIFAIAGRNYPGRYEDARNQAYNRITYLLAGLGQTPVTPSMPGSFLITSDFDVSHALEAWQPELEISYHQGHTVSACPTVHAGLNKEDRIVFQWSAGGYFHPDLADDTMWEFNFYDIWGHNQWGGLPDLSFLPITAGPVLATVLAAITRSSWLSGIDINIFKKDAITLSSVEDYWSGRRGYQQYPVVANTGSIAVYTASGPVEPFTQRDDKTSNTHFPKVTQDGNVALIQYRPKIDLLFLGMDLRVSLHWPAEKFDETRRNGKWEFGREGDSYVAVLKQCNAVVNGLMACKNNFAQTWSIVVGDEEMYGSFDEFEQSVSSARLSEEWVYDEFTRTWDYISSIEMDGKEIASRWQGEPEQNDGPGEVLIDGDDAGFTVYPNPARDNIHIALPPAIANNDCRLSVFSVDGSEMVNRIVSGNDPNISINTSDWPSGLYTITLDNGENQLVRKMLKMP